MAYNDLMQDTYDFLMDYELNGNLTELGRSRFVGAYVLAYGTYCLGMMEQ